MEALYDLFRRNFPFCVREQSFARSLLSQKENTVFTEIDDAGRLFGAAVLEQNTLLMLCVDKEYRNRGIGSRLLEAAEKAVRKAGYDHLVIGAGTHYLMPGIPVCRPVVEEKLETDAVYEGLEDHSSFFAKRGYSHSWGCNCFDMRRDLKDFTAVPFVTEGITYSWAVPEDMEAVAACTDDAHPSFTKYYRDPDKYRKGNDKRVLAARCGNDIAGVLIVSFGSEGPGLGSVGCTAVKNAYQGRKIASNLVILGTEKLQEAGMEKAFLGYTYTGLDRMYGFAGYKICVYYYMAKKQFH